MNKYWKQTFALIDFYGKKYMPKYVPVIASDYKMLKKLRKYGAKRIGDTVLIRLNETLSIGE